MQLDNNLEPTLEDVIIQIRSGHDVQAGYQYLFDEMNPYLARVVSNVLNNTDKEEVEDLVGKAWVSIVESLEDFDPEIANFKTWSSNIAKYKAIDAGRKASRRKPSISIDEPTIRYTLASTGTATPEQHLDVKETEEAIFQAFLGYRNKTDVLLYLMKLEFGLKYPELKKRASAVGIDLSVKALQHRIQRVRNYLRTELNYPGS